MVEFNTRELADAASLKSYDTALPLDWYDDVYTKTGFWPQSYGFVWCYDQPSIWGEPYPLTYAAKILLRWYGTIVNVTYKYANVDIK